MNKDEEYLIRMEKDVERRHSKEQTINFLVTNKTGKIKEGERLKTFDRLINDAKRRLESVDRIEDIQQLEQTEKLFQKKGAKKYSHKDWQEIYETRFERFEDEKNKKIKNKRIEKKYKDKELEEKIVQKTKLSKKCSEAEIAISSKRLCDDEMRRRKNNLINLNRKFRKDDNRETKLYSKKLSYEPNYNV